MLIKGGFISTVLVHLASLKQTEIDACLLFGFIYTTPKVNEFERGKKQNVRAVFVVGQFLYN